MLLASEGGSNCIKTFVTSGAGTNSFRYSRSVSKSRKRSASSLAADLTFASVPSGSAAVIYDETLEQAYFVPDEAGDYVVSLVVNNGELDSEPDEVTITALSMVDAAVMNLEDAADYVNSLSVQVFLRSSSKKLLVSKINNALAQIDTGDYAGAASYLNRFVLSKVDGCQKGGSPDKTDLILSCPEQEVVYNLVSEAIDLLEAAS